MVAEYLEILFGPAISVSLLSFSNQVVDDRNLIRETRPSVAFSAYAGGSNLWERERTRRGPRAGCVRICSVLLGKSESREPLNTSGAKGLASKMGRFMARIVRNSKPLRRSATLKRPNLAARCRATTCSEVPWYWCRSCLL